jgi:hypothetical protein
MTCYQWLGLTGDLDDEDNYSPTGVPTADDLLWIPASGGDCPRDGTSYAGLVYFESGAGIIPGESTVATFSGVVFVFDGALLDGLQCLNMVVSHGTIAAGDFHGPVFNLGDGITGGTFAGPVFDYVPANSTPEYCTLDGGYFPLSAAGLEMTDCLAGNIMLGKTIAGVEGTAVAGPTAEEIADAVLSRSVSHVEAAAVRSCLATVVLAAVNKANTADHAGYLTVYRTDGVTEHTRIPIAASAGAAPIEGIG